MTDLLPVQSILDDLSLVIITQSHACDGSSTTTGTSLRLCVSKLTSFSGLELWSFVDDANSSPDFICLIKQEIILVHLFL
jgi:hypothetical protein